MLPGFRFLLAAIVLSMSILVFGLGAAALLRAAHEEFVSTPSWRATPETVFARQNEATGPVLAMLRVEPPPAEPKASDNVPVAAAPAEPTATVSTAEPAAAVSTAEPERIAALKAEDSAAPEMTKPDGQVPDNPAQSEAAPATADAPAAAEARIAATEQVVQPMNEAAPAASEAAPAASEAISAPASPQADIASTKIATLGGPPVTTETQPPAKAASAKPDRSVINKRLQARRAAQRRRIALRAQQARLTPQPPADPFAQPPAAARKR
jgi:hypothetical protein